MLRQLARRTASQLITRAKQPALRRALCDKATQSASPPPPPPPAELGLIERIMKQVQSEVANASTNPANKYGFFGACCNWFLGLSAVYGAMREGPEVISLKMTGVMLCYSTLFGRWAGWAVTPRNYVLAGSHIFNVVAQCNQMRRVLVYKMETGGEAAKKEVTEMATKAAAAGAIVCAAIFSADKMKAIVAPIGPAYLSSPGGPFTIHPWPPMTKLAISGTSMLEVNPQRTSAHFTRVIEGSAPAVCPPFAMPCCSCVRRHRR